MPRKSAVLKVRARASGIADDYLWPVAWALTGAKADERITLETMIEQAEPPSGHRQILIGDKNYFGDQFETMIKSSGITLLQPARKGEQQRPGSQFFKPLRQIIESVNDTLKGQLNLEAHHGRTLTGVTTRVGIRLLALTAAILAQQHHRCTHPPFSHRLRPLTLE